MLFALTVNMKIILAWRYYFLNELYFFDTSHVIWYELVNIDGKIRSVGWAELAKPNKFYPDQFESNNPSLMNL
jgi:hypothetical protein